MPLINVVKIESLLRIGLGGGCKIVKRKTVTRKLRSYQNDNYIYKLYIFIHTYVSESLCTKKERRGWQFKTLKRVKFKSNLT